MPVWTDTLEPVTLDPREPLDDDDEDDDLPPFDDWYLSIAQRAAPSAVV